MLLDCDWLISDQLIPNSSTKLGVDKRRTMGGGAFYKHMITTATNTLNF
jgi:hypothetical protein